MQNNSQRLPPTPPYVSRPPTGYPAYQEREPIPTPTEKPDIGGPATRQPLHWSHIITILAFIVSIAGIFFFFASQEKRELVYAVSPTPTVIVSSQHCRDLIVSYRDKELGCVDITAVQVAIWNKGRQSIRAENILSPTYIRTTPPVDILETSLINVSREVVEFSLLHSLDSWKVGHVPVEWRILEKNDGAMIQLIYLGGTEIEFDVVGDIEGVSEIKRVDFNDKWRANQ
ncbi:MAG: hypothetical protein ISS52_06985 [Dehalococcoidia bacterium]|nr:hypothetical protein [Dehalococcoidia bacterium]